jgi:hypothetical protein
MRRYVLTLFVLLFVACRTGGRDQGGFEAMDEQAALERGDAIVQSTYRALSSRLQKAIVEAGPVHALEYCSVAALPITDSLARHHGVRIKRTSTRLRSPYNIPDDHESGQLYAYLNAYGQEGLPLEVGPQVFEIGDSIAYYQPILIVSPLCLQCHGHPSEDISLEVMHEIERRYPGDLAINYELGDLRGLWSIRWPR